MEEQEQTEGRGTIGNQIFDQVESYVNDGGLSRTQAFQRISDETGRRAGTVAANYYRVARQRGAELQPRTPRGSRARRGQDGVEAAVDRAQDALRELTDLVSAQKREIEELREENKQFQKLRKLVAKGL